MSGVEIRQRAASDGQRGGKRGQEGRPAPLHRASWSTAPIYSVGQFIQSTMG